MFRNPNGDRLSKTAFVDGFRRMLVSHARVLSALECVCAFFCLFVRRKNMKNARRARGANHEPLNSRVTLTWYILVVHRRGGEEGGGSVEYSVVDTSAPLIFFSLDARKSIHSPNTHVPTYMHRDALGTLTVTRSFCPPLNARRSIMSINLQ